MILNRFIRMAREKGLGIIQLPLAGARPVGGRIVLATIQMTFA